MQQPLLCGSSPADRLSDFILGFLIFPSIIIVYLSNYPKRKYFQMVYILAFTMSLSLIEYIVYLKKGILYYNGWNIGWSVLIYLGAFPLLRLHHTNPLLAWLIFFALTGAGIFYFKIPISQLL